MPERKKALISGASSGIGRATVVRFAQEGWDVCLTARRETEMLSLRASLPPGDHLVCPGDYSDPATAEAIRATITERWGRLDVLVNCAGVYMAGDPIASPLDVWRAPFDIMVNGAVHLTRVAVPLMREGGRIIHITSIHGERVERNGSAYAMAKAALNQYCRALALELADRGILVNAIAPGYMATDNTAALRADPVRSRAILERIPVGRWGKAEDLQGAVVFLASAASDYMTGQTIFLDGGMSL